MGKTVAGLFDLDGVIFDTEPEYTRFWSEQGKLAHPEIPDFSSRIKGQTLKEILTEYFPEEQQAREIVRRIDDFEQQMDFPPVRGSLEFVGLLKQNGVKVAIVTSSNENKMRNVYRAYPGLKSLFDVIITADQITRSKPDPECYLLAAQQLDVKPEECVVFEDSFSGLEAGRRARMKIVGLATTNPADLICDKADRVIPDFCDFTFSDFSHLQE